MTVFGPTKRGVNYPDYVQPKPRAPFTLHQLEDRIRTCTHCPPGTKELGWGYVNQIMFIGQGPALSNTDGLRGTSDFDKFFIPLVLKAKINKPNFYFTNIVKTPVSRVTQAMITHGGTHVKDEILIVKPKIIIALGAYASSWADTVGLRCRRMVHPSATRYGSISEDEWVKQLVVLTSKFINKLYARHREGLPQQEE